MSFKDSMHSAVADLLRTKFDVTDLTEVTDVGQDNTKVFYEGCSCEWDEVNVPITYRTAAGATETFNYVGDFAGLIRSLTDQ